MNQHSRLLYLLIAISLAASAIHFADNAFHLDRYPGPPWFTPAGVLLAWLGLPLLAWLALRTRSGALLIVFSLTGFLGFAHFVGRRFCGLDWTCNLTILGEAAASAALLAFLVLPRRRLSAPG